MTKKYWAACLRAFASIWRFQTLRIARTVFPKRPTPLVLQRPFFSKKLFLDVSRTNAHRLLYLEGARFIKEKSLLEVLALPERTVVDVGANIGYYMTLISESVGSEGKVICFEPDPNNLVELKRNKNKNNISNVEIVESAVGDKNKKVSFTEGINGKVEDKGCVKVPQVTLDSWLEEPVDAIKIDVEGYEGAVLEGATSTIDCTHPNLLVEIHPWLSTDHSHKDIFEFLESRYANVEYYEVRLSDIWSKVTYNYLGGDPVVRIQNRGELLADCMDGNRQSTFWAMCQN